MITNGSFPNLVVLDVRNQSEYDSGHIYGAVWIPVWNLTARIGELAGDKNHEIIVYCKSGDRSAIASGILDSYNFTKVYNMLGGILAWESAGYPVWIATVHNLNTGWEYDTIQAALNAPQTLDGNTIQVDAGTYHEHVVVNKIGISLIGENKSTTVIDGNGSGNVVDIVAPYVKIKGFTIRNGVNGIFTDVFDFNIISGNIVTNNQNGINLSATCPCRPAEYNTITNNTIRNNGFGISLGYGAINNNITHNNFVNNAHQTETQGSINFWDDGYPSGGNFWSNYNGTDSYSGPYQNLTGGDGIGDTPYVVDANNRDNYPLMKPGGDIKPPVAEAGSNQSIFQGMTVTFNASGSTDDVAIKSYVWTFNDTTLKTLTGVKPHYAFNNVGDFKVTLNVTDYASKWDTDTTWIHVRLRGDVNGDGRVTLADVGLLDLIFSEIYPYTCPPYNVKNMSTYYYNTNPATGKVEHLMPDVNGDGIVSLADIGKLDLIFSGIL
jgi:parallel beta-helix repeat protein